FQVTPKVSHLHAVKRIFRYLKGQPKLELWYPKDSPFDLEAYNDSDYAGASLDRKSTTGGMDKSENHKKIIKSEQARTRESEEYKAEARKAKPQPIPLSLSSHNKPQGPILQFLESYL
ncbi:hypothetical protein Tco_1451564, partial [Tanacetum coccineum]